MLSLKKNPLPLPYFSLNLLNSSTRYSISCSAMRTALAPSWDIVWVISEREKEKRNCEEREREKTRHSSLCVPSLFLSACSRWRARPRPLTTPSRRRRPPPRPRSRPRRSAAPARRPRQDGMGERGATEASLCFFSTPASFPLSLSLFLCLSLPCTHRKSGTSASPCTVRFREWAVTKRERDRERRALHCTTSSRPPILSIPSSFFPRLHAGPDSAACAPLIAAHKVCLRAEGFNIE